jgi:hypothetical protein
MKASFQRLDWKTLKCHTLYLQRLIKYRGQWLPWGRRNTKQGLPLLGAGCAVDYVLPLAQLAPLRMHRTELSR